MSELPQLHNIVRDPKKFELVMKVCDTEFYVKLLGPLLFHWLNYRECDDILRWSLKHRYTGKNLLCLYRDRFNYSPLNLTKWVLKELHREKELKAVVVGKDYLG